MNELEMCNLLADYIKEDKSIPVDELCNRGLCQLKHAKIILEKFTSHNSDYTKCPECGEIYLKNEVQQHTGLCGYCNPPF